MNEDVTAEDLKAQFYAFWVLFAGVPGLAMVIGLGCVAYLLG